MLVVWAPKWPPRCRRALILRSCNTLVCLGSANLVGRPRCVTVWGRYADLVALPASSGQPRFYVGNEGLPMRCAPNGPTSISGCLGTSDLRPSWGWHASGGSTRLLAAMQDIWVSLHSICSKINRLLASSFTASTISSSVSSLTTFSRDAPSKILLGILGY
jgi:hypothetical protein